MKMRNAVLAVFAGSVVARAAVVTAPVHPLVATVQALPTFVVSDMRSEITALPMLAIRASLPSLPTAATPLIANAAAASQAEASRLVVSLVAHPEVIAEQREPLSAVLGEDAVRTLHDAAQRYGRIASAQPGSALTRKLDAVRGRLDLANVKSVADLRPRLDGLFDARRGAAAAPAEVARPAPRYKPTIRVEGVPVPNYYGIPMLDFNGVKLPKAGLFVPTPSGELFVAKAIGASGASIDVGWPNASDLKRYLDVLLAARARGVKVRVILPWSPFAPGADRGELSGLIRALAHHGVVIRTAKDTRHPVNSYPFFVFDGRLQAGFPRAEDYYPSGFTGFVAPDEPGSERLSDHFRSTWARTKRDRG